jgi:hypothetical protein
MTNNVERRKPRSGYKSPQKLAAEQAHRKRLNGEYAQKDLWSNPTSKDELFARRPYDPNDPTTYRWNPRYFRGSKPKCEVTVNRDVSTSPLTSDEYRLIFDMAALRVRESTIAHELGFRFSSKTPTKYPTWLEVKEQFPLIQFQLDQGHAQHEVEIQQIAMRHIREGNVSLLMWQARHFLGQNRNLSMSKSNSSNFELNDPVVDAVQNTTDEQKLKLCQLRDHIYGEHERETSVSVTEVQAEVVPAPQPVEPPDLPDPTNIISISPNGSSQP